MFRYAPILPHPEDKHPSPLRPYERKNGVYVLTRDPHSVEVTYWEPGGSTYDLEYFECENILSRILELGEQEVNEILDRLWNFSFVAWDIKNPEIIIVDPEVAIQKWPTLLDQVES